MENTCRPVSSGYGHTLGEWADAYECLNPPNPHGACFLAVSISDSFEHGVIDHIFIEMAGGPIKPVPQAIGQWTILHGSKEAEMGITVYPPIVPIDRRAGRASSRRGLRF